MSTNFSLQVLEYFTKKLLRHENLVVFDTTFVFRSSSGKVGHPSGLCDPHLLCSACIISFSSAALNHKVGLVFSVFSFKILNARSTFCCTRIRAYDLILFMKYDVVFASIPVESPTLVLNGDGSSLATHSYMASWYCFFLSRVNSSNSISLSACVKKKRFFIGDIRERCCHLTGSCLYVFPDFDTYFLRNFDFQSGEKVCCHAD